MNRPAVGILLLVGIFVVYAILFYIRGNKELMCYWFYKYIVRIKDDDILRGISP